MKKISIITPSYNQGEYLERTIKSILNQNYDNLEYIIIDGGSTDASVEIIKKYNKHLAYWVSEKDKGQSQAINKGFQKASGDIITWINSDDQLLHNALFKVADYFEKNDDIALIHGRTILYNDKSRQIRGANAKDLDCRYLAGMPFPQPSSFFKREIIDNHGLLDESLHFGMDYDLLCKIALNHKILKVDDIFSNYLLHNTSKSVVGQIEFANDWAKVFSKVLRSIPETRNIIEEMKELNLYYKDITKYKTEKTLDEKFMNKVFLYFLLNQIIFRYQALEMKEVHKILRFVKSKSSLFFKENDLAKIYWRTKIPVLKNIIALYREVNT